MRGFDYYRHTAFEFIPDEGSPAAEALGSQSTVLGGGRYDGLIETLGGPHTPSVGWAAGIERLAMLVGERTTDRLQIAVAAENPHREPDVIEAVAIFRRMGLSAEAFISGSPRKRYDKARKAESDVLISMDVRDGADFQSWVANIPAFPEERAAFEKFNERWPV